MAESCLSIAMKLNDLGIILFCGRYFLYNDVKIITTFCSQCTENPPFRFFLWDTRYKNMHPELFRIKCSFVIGRLILGGGGGGEHTPFVTGFFLLSLACQISIAVNLKFHSWFANFKLTLKVGHVR